MLALTPQCATLKGASTSSVKSLLQKWLRHWGISAWLKGLRFPWSLSLYLFKKKKVFQEDFQNLCLKFKLCSVIFSSQAHHLCSFSLIKTPMIKLFKNSITVVLNSTRRCRTWELPSEIPFRPAWPSYIISSAFLPGTMLYLSINPLLSHWNIFFCPQFFLHIKSDKSPGRSQGFAQRAWSPAWCYHPWMSLQS